MANIEFTKLVATGNDFILLDNRTGELEKRIIDFSRFASEACERKRSIGADGLLVLEGSKKADLTMRIFNPDGSEVNMCGNGSRCVAFYTAIKKITGKTLSIETKAGILKAAVDVGAKRARIEMTEPKNLKSRFHLTVSGKTIDVGFIDTGVPHVVHFVDDLQDVHVKALGSAIRFHDYFSPEGTNANFVKVIDRHNLSIRTYERGVEDETFACGTGAVAGSIISAELDFMDSPVRVKTSGGEILTIYFKKRKEGYGEVFLEGEVKLVYEGSVHYV